MRATTREAIKAICAIDESIGDERLQAALEVLAGKADVSAARHSADRMLKARDVADILHCCTKTVRALAKKGKIRRIYLAGAAERAGGYSEDSLREFMQA